MSNVTDLLHTVRFDQKDLNREHTLLLMEFQVNPETAPFLVSSSDKVLWIRRAHGGRVRAAVREVDVLDFSREVVAEVYHMGKAAEWGNTTPLTLWGVEACVEHLKSYGLDEVVVLTHPDVPWDSWGVDVDDTWKKTEIIQASWLPAKMVVVVPADRGYVGTIWRVGQNKILSVVHNPSRGLAVAWDGE